jgi:hypothetical protein
MVTRHSRLSRIRDGAHETGALQRAARRPRRILHRLDLDRVAARLDLDGVDDGEPRHLRAFQPMMARDQRPARGGARPAGPHDDRHDLAVLGHHLAQRRRLVGPERAQPVADQYVMGGKCQDGAGRFNGHLRCGGHV